MTGVVDLVLTFFNRETYAIIHVLKTKNSIY